MVWLTIETHSLIQIYDSEVHSTVSVSHTFENESELIELCLVVIIEESAVARRASLIWQK